MDVKKKKSPENYSTVAIPRADLFPMVFLISKFTVDIWYRQKLSFDLLVALLVSLPTTKQPYRISKRIARFNWFVALFVLVLNAIAWKNPSEKSV